MGLGVARVGWEGWGRGKGGREEVREPGSIIFLTRESEEYDFFFFLSFAVFVNYNGQ